MIACFYILQTKQLQYILTRPAIQEESFRNMVAKGDKNVKSIHTGRTTNSGKWQHSTKIQLSQFSQLCLLIKKTSLGATRRARQIQARCCKMARALSLQLPRDLKVYPMIYPQETLLWHNLYTNRHLLPVRRRNCAETQILSMPSQNLQGELSAVSVCLDEN